MHSNYLNYKDLLTMTFMSYVYVSHFLYFYSWMQKLENMRIKSWGMFTTSSIGFPNYIQAMDGRLYSFWITIAPDRKRLKLTLVHRQWTLKNSQWDKGVTEQDWHNLAGQ